MTRYPDTQSPAQISSGQGPFMTGENNALYQHYFSRLLAAATTRYRWLGLGPWIDPMRVEWLLVTQGLCAFTFVKQNEPLPALGVYGPDDYNDRPDGLSIFNDRFTVTQAMITGHLDDTFSTSGYRTFTPNGANGISFNTNQPLPLWKGVPIWGDANRSYYDRNTIALFAGRLAQAALVVDTNLRQTMRGKVALTDQDKSLTSQIALSGLASGIDVMVASPQIVDGIKAVDFGVHPDTVERSHVVNMRLMDEALEALGVESPAQEKKERLTAGESETNRSQIAAIRRLTLTPRKQAATLINRRYFGGEPVVEVVDQWE